MKKSPLAGKPVEPAMLVNVPKLITAYYTDVPDPSVPEQWVAFGTSGHRGSSFQKAFNEGHILAISQAIGLHRGQQKIDGPLFLGMDTHCPLRAGPGQRAGGTGGQRGGCHDRGEG
jgi:phosphoglucomutase